MASKRLRKKRAKTQGPKSHIRYKQPKGVKARQRQQSMQRTSLKWAEPKQMQLKLPDWVDPKEAKKVGKKKKRQLQKQKIFVDLPDLIIMNFYNDLERFRKAPLYDEFIDWIHRLIDRYGPEVVAYMIDKARKDGHIITYKEMYEREANYLFREILMGYLPDLNKYEVVESLDAELEYWEDWELS